MNRVSRNTIYKAGFREAYNLVDKDKQFDFVRTLMERTGWKQSTFYNRMTGLSPTKFIEKDILINTFKEYGIDLNSLIQNN
jgi:hypothetical protein